MTVEPTGVLEGRSAIVTGAGRGLGLAMATALAHAGANLVLASRSEAQLREAAAEIERLGVGAHVVATDVTDPRATDRLASETLKRFGRIDVLVNNAGALRHAPVLDMSDEDWDACQANVRGVFNCTRSVGAAMVEQGGGKIINMASAFVTTAVSGFTAYSTSKAAIVQFTRSVAYEWARHGIQANAIAPGYFSTDMNAEARADEEVSAKLLRGIPARRFGDPEELGPLVVYLASAASDYMTGETIVVDGGMQL